MNPMRALRRFPLALKAASGRLVTDVERRTYLCQARFPDMAERFAIFDLFGDEYPRLCLNRVRLFTYGYHDDDERPVPDFQGIVDNPLVSFDRKKHAA